MRNRFVISLACLLVALIAVTRPLGVKPAYSKAINSAAASHGCTDIPINLTFVAITGAAISNDISGTPYQGLGNEVIHICSGTNDATMVLARSNRSVSIQFPEPIPGSVLMATGPPSFAGGPAFQSQPFFNVRNVLNSGQITATSPATDFYTRMVVNYLPAPDGNSYGLRFHPDDSACPGDLPCAPDLDPPNVADMNLPVETSWLRVHFVPAPYPSQPWSLSNAAKWYVDGEQLDTAVPPTGLHQRGTLNIKSKSGGDGAQEGQYAMPFQIMITALGPI
jgi:hypothetical protein